MKFSIKHEIPGRMRVHFAMKRMSFKEADTLQYYLLNLPGIINAKVYERTADAAVSFSCSRDELIRILRAFHFENVNVPDNVLENSPRELNAFYRDRLIGRIMIRCAKKLFLPAPVRAALTIFKAAGYIARGIDSLLHRRITVSVLDATAIAVSVIRGDFETAGSVMFLLNVGEIMEEWTHKKSVNDLARSMSLNIENVCCGPEKQRC